MQVSRDGQRQSPWQVIADTNNREHQLSQKADVIIIGGGITGLTTALMLQREGKQCLLLEAKNIGFGTTGGTTAHINTFFDTTYHQIEKDFSDEGAKLVADAGKKAITLVKSLIDEYGIDCDFEFKNGLLYSQDEQQNKELEEIYAASISAGVAVAYHTDNDVPVKFNSVINFEAQAQFHPLKYIYGLADQFILLGGTILEGTFVHDVSYESEQHKVDTSSGSFFVKEVVYATHLPPGINQFSFKCAPYRSYVLGFTLTDESLYPSALVYDMEEPYHYFRTHIINGEKIVILGGEDLKTGHGDPTEAFAKLEAYARNIYQVAEMRYQWSSQYYVPVDGLPYIGRAGDTNAAYVATGYNGNGMTWGTIAGLIISDAILKRPNPYAELLNPNRLKPLASASEFIKENADVAFRFVADRLKLDQIDVATALPNDQGQVIIMHGKKIAIYKDLNGELHALDPVCTHAGCIVNFNTAEKSWDCPCHGGRFDLAGNVLTGPPRAALKSIKIDD